MKLIVLLVFVLLAAAPNPICARMPTQNSDNMVVKQGGVTPYKLINDDELEGSLKKKKKEDCIPKDQQCSPVQKCCNSCVTDPIYGFFKCS
ncbi:unnamed protein product [Amaranthus hypochondriacus]